MRLFKKAAAFLSRIWNEVPPNKEPFFRAPDVYVPDATASKHVHNPSFVAAALQQDEDLDFADEDYVDGRTRRRKYNSDNPKERACQSSKAWREKKKAAALAAKGIVYTPADPANRRPWTKRNSDEERKLANREKSKRCYYKKKGDKPSKYTRRYLGVPSADRAAYNRAYYEQTKATGNTDTTFTRGYGYGS